MVGRATAVITVLSIYLLTTLNIGNSIQGILITNLCDNNMATYHPGRISGRMPGQEYTHCINEV